MKHIFTTLFSTLVALAYASIVHAVELQVDYPAVKGEEFSGGGPLAWLKYIYFGAFAIIGIVAFASLVYAGIQYMTSRTPGGVEDSKDRIKKTLLGLLLAGASFLILSLINPDLVRLREPNLPLPEAPERSAFTPNPGSADGRENPVNQLLPNEPGAECTQETGGCGFWRESILLSCERCREANGNLSPTRRTCVQPGAPSGNCPTTTTSGEGTVTINGQCNQSAGAPANQRCNATLGLVCDTSNTCRKRDGLSCVISLECRTGSQCIGLKCQSTAQDDQQDDTPKESFPPESNLVPPLTKAPTLDGLKEISLNTNTTITYSVVFYGNSGDKIYFTTSFGAQALTGGKDGVATIGSAGSVSVDMPIIFLGVCMQTTTTTSSSVTIQAARGSSDGTMRSAWITTNDSIKIIWPAC